MIFIEDRGFEKARRQLLDDEELFAVMETLAAAPNSGAIIPRSGGLRKLRWAAKGRGKRGGVRVIYFWWLSEDKILLLDVYAKNEKENLAVKDLEKLKRKVIP